MRTTTAEICGCFRIEFPDVFCIDINPPGSYSCVVILHFIDSVFHLRPTKPLRDAMTNTGLISLNYRQDCKQRGQILCFRLLFTTGADRFHCVSAH